jgi:hypothetical protein
MGLLHSCGSAHFIGARDQSSFIYSHSLRGDMSHTDYKGQKSGFLGKDPYGSGMRHILSVLNCRSWAKKWSVEHQEDRMAFPGVRAPTPAIAEDSGQLVIWFSFPKHHLGCKTGSEEPLSGTPLLRKHIVPLVVGIRVSV